MPRTAFGQDLLYSLGAFVTVCEIKRHDAVRRLEHLARTGQNPGWTEKTSAPTSKFHDVEEVPSDEATSSIDVQRYAADQISTRIAERSTDHGLTLLIEAILGQGDPQSLLRRSATALPDGPAGCLWLAAGVVQCGAAGN